MGGARDDMRITVQPLREEALRAGFAALLERLPEHYTLVQFEAALADWDVRAFHDGSRTIGMLMVRGPELHVAVLPEVRGRWLSRRLIREVFAPILERYGEAQTSVEPENARGLDFVRRIRDGFASLRFDPLTVIGGVASSVIGSAITGGMQAKASKDAAQQASDAQQAATNAQLQMFNTQNAQQAPYRQTGQNALSIFDKTIGGVGAGPNDVLTWETGYVPAAEAAAATGITGRAQGERYASDFPNYSTTQLPGYVPVSIAKGVPKVAGIEPGFFTHQFNAQDLSANLAPNWQFALQQGQGAAANALNLTGGLGGNFGKGLVDYTLAKSGDLYQQAYNNYTANQSNIFNRLSTLAGLGSAANQQSAGLAGSLAPSIAQSIGATGAAQAAGTVGAANALAGGANNALGWYQLSQFMQPQTSFNPASSYNSAGTFQPYYTGTDAGGGPAYG